MKLRFTLLLSVFALAACATETPAPIAPTLAEFVAVETDNYTCKPADFTDVDFASVAAVPARYYEKCIRLRALYANNRLFRDAKDLKLAQAGIAVAAKDGTVPQGLRTHPQFVIAAGRLRSCAEILRKYTVLHERNEAAASTQSPTQLETWVTFHVTDTCADERDPHLFVVTVQPIPTAMD